MKVVFTTLSFGKLSAFIAVLGTGVYLVYALHDRGDFLAEKLPNSEMFSFEDRLGEASAATPVVHDGERESEGEYVRRYKYPIPPAMPVSALELVDKLVPLNCKEHVLSVLSIHPYVRPEIHTNGKGDKEGSLRYLGQISRAFRAANECDFDFPSRQTGLMYVDRACRDATEIIETPRTDIPDNYIDALHFCARTVTLYRLALLKRMTDKTPLSEIEDVTLLEQLYRESGLYLEYRYPVDLTRPTSFIREMDETQVAILNRILEIEPDHEAALAEKVEYGVSLLLKRGSHVPGLDEDLFRLERIAVDPVGSWKLAIIYYAAKKDGKRLGETADRLLTHLDSNKFHISDAEMIYFKGYSLFLQNESKQAVDVLRRYFAAKGSTNRQMDRAVRMALQSLSLDPPGTFVTADKLWLEQNPPAEPPREVSSLPFPYPDYRLPPLRLLGTR